MTVQGGLVAERDRPLSIEEINDIVAKVRYKDWRFLVYRLHASDLVVLRIQFDTADAYSPDGRPVRQYGRPWLLEPHSASELLQTVWLAILTAEEHEAREAFAYEGRRIFNPHKNHLARVAL